MRNIETLTAPQPLFLKKKKSWRLKASKTVKDFPKIIPSADNYGYISIVGLRTLGVNILGLIR